MTPEERELIAGLFDRLKTADSPDKDRDAEDLIRRKVTEVPAAPYLLTQTVLVQEQALRGAEARIASLEQQLAEAKRNAPSAAPSGGSFLGRIRRPWETAPSTAPISQPVYQQPGYAPASAPAGGGFLQNAMATAAGVAGGALLFEGIQRMLGHGAGPFGGTVAGSPWGATPTENVTVNNYYGDGANPVRQASADADADAPSYQDANYDGGDDGGPVDDGGSDIA
jgi:hypothetical protein